jgi:proline iminopeptidase
MKNKIQMFLLVCLSMLTACKKLNEPGNLVPRTADQDPSIPSIKINDRILHSEAFGHPDSTMIVCIHGGPSADYRYMLMAKDFVKYGYRVVFYDQIGSGLSQRFNESYFENKNVDDIFLKELRGVINHYKTSSNQKVILFGHSWGAIMATAYAGKYPGEIHGLALIEPGGLKWEDIVEYIKRAQNVPLWSEMTNDILYQDQFISTQKDQHEILDYKLTLLASNGSPNTKETLTGKDGFWRFGAMINTVSFNIGQKDKPDMSEGIQNYNRPVLFIHGGGGDVYTDAWAQKISAVYKTKEIFKVEGVGHSGMLEPSPWNNTTLPKLISYFKSL